MRRFPGRLIVLFAGVFASMAVPWLVYPQAKSIPMALSKGLMAIKDVTVIDVAMGHHLSGVDVLIRGDRIEAIGPKLTLPREASQVSGKGKFLIPGLWDMHTHHQATGVESLDLFVAKGVVGTRDMGADVDFIMPLRERVNSGEILGPEIVASGPMLDDAPAGFPYRRRVRNAQEAREAVRDLKRLGFDFIKVHDHTPREVFFAIADEAPKGGLPFAGHVPAAVTVEEAADAGIRSIEHLANYRVLGECSTGDTYSPSGCARLFDKLAAKGVWETPTMAFFQSIPDLFSGAPLAHAEYASDSLLALTRDNVKLSHLDAKVLDKFRLGGRLSLQAIHDLHTRGNRFMAGCDGIVPGFCVHDELVWFTKAGFSPLEALQTATINPARFLGREASLGTVEVGKRADLVMLDADPSIDIRNSASIAAVIIRGKLITKPAIDAMIASRRRGSVQ